MKSKNLKKRRILQLLDFYLSYHFFLRKQLSRELPFFPKRSKRPKRLTKHQILRNILPFYDSVGISRKQCAFRGFAETYNVEVIDTKSLADSF